MNLPAPALPAHEPLVACFWSGDVMRSRSVSDRVLTGLVEVPAPPARLLADWDAEITQRIGLEPGDVEVLSLARSRRRWPDYRHCVAAVSDWTRALGLPEMLATSEVALMACRGARYHHDAEYYGGAAFCNLFLSEDKGLDLYFPGTGHRLALVRGTTVIFDTAQPHAVVRRGSDRFDAADFALGQDCSQVFLTWELPIECVELAQAMGVAFDIAPGIALPLDEEQVWRGGVRVRVCEQTGRWC